MTAAGYLGFDLLLSSNRLYHLGQSGIQTSIQTLEIKYSELPQSTSCVNA